MSDRLYCVITMNVRNGTHHDAISMSQFLARSLMGLREAKASDVSRFRLDETITMVNNPLMDDQRYVQNSIQNRVLCKQRQRFFLGECELFRSFKSIHRLSFYPDITLHPDPKIRTEPNRMAFE